MSKNIPQREIDDYLSKVKLENKLSQKQKNDCDKEISEKEVGKVIQNLKNGKSPGCDGLTTEFYKKFWEDIKGKVRVR